MPLEFSARGDFVNSDSDVPQHAIINAHARRVRRFPPEPSISLHNVLLFCAGSRRPVDACRGLSFADDAACRSQLLKCCKPLYFIIVAPDQR